MLSGAFRGCLVTIGISLMLPACLAEGHNGTGKATLNGTEAGAMHITSVMSTGIIGLCILTYPATLQ